VGYRVVYQQDANDCGPACLAMVSAYYGKRQSIARLRQEAGTDRQGTNLAGMLQAATQAGFRARGVRTGPQGLAEVPLPAIAHWLENGRNHFVVVFKRGPRRVTIADPALGVRRLAPQTFANHWTGILLLLRPTPQLRDLSTPGISRLVSLLRHHRRLLVDALFAAVLMTILGLSSSFFIQVLVDYVFLVGANPTMNWLGLGMLLVLGGRVTFLGLRAYLLAHLSHRIDADIVLGYHHHLLGLPLDFFRTRRTGEILSRMTDAMKIRVALSTTGLSVIVDSATFVLTSALMCLLHWKLAVASLLPLPLLVVALAVLTSPMKRAQRRAMERAAQFETHTVETIGSIETIKAFAAEAPTRQRAEIRFMEAIASGFRAEMFSLHASTSAALLTGASSLCLLWVGGRAVLASDLSVGQLMALYTMLATVIAPVERLASANASVQDALVAAERLGEVFDVDSEVVHRPQMEINRTIKGSVRFDNVSLRYGICPPVIQNWTLDIEAGECCRIVGPSGSGKTTLLRSLARLVTPESGRILVDGIDVQGYALEALRRQVVYVAQDSAILSTSIGENIRLGRPDATAEEILEAARHTGAHSFIQKMPLGYNTVVGERGATLSGGERQRLVLARAMLNSPPILILDEPMNHLDGACRAAVHDIIERRRRERRTTIFVSHESLPADITVNIDNPDERAHAIGN
jgi:ABC-type bacteriocin/lantibiotic exporter with double-glycine peptidase domain